MRWAASAIYINKVESLEVTSLSSPLARQQKEVGEVVATRCARTREAIDADLIARKISSISSFHFLTRCETGKEVDNLRLYINNAWDAEKRHSIVKSMK